MSTQPEDICYVVGEDYHEQTWFAACRLKTSEGVFTGRAAVAQSRENLDRIGLEALLKADALADARRQQAGAAAI